MMMWWSRHNDPATERTIRTLPDGASARSTGRTMREVDAGDEPMCCRAQARDLEALEDLVALYRPQLQLHCYRILGSIQDAEDIVQETLLSAWRAFDRFDGRSTRGWLYRIATNRCLNHLRATSRRPRAANVLESRSWLAAATRSDAPWWLESHLDALIDDVAQGPEARYDARESIALLFVVGLQRLPTRQRAALVLRDVLGFTVDEVADLLGTSTASVNSALQRARYHFRPSQEGQLVSLPSSRQEAAVANHFANAYEQGDVSQIVALLIEECSAAMPS
jgi:RNA polymerase sigma-70 factor (TIGR02960 family)